MTYTQLTINTDGGARRNPGPAGIGVVCYSDKDSSTPLFQLSEYIGETTNNVAEYTAVIKALEHLLSQNINAQKIKFILDSELVVKQITGQYKIKQPHLQKLAIKLKSLLYDLRKNSSNITFFHVLRAHNKQADALVNQAIDSSLK